MNQETTPCRESFVLYRSFYDSIGRLPDDVQLVLFRAVCNYGFDQVVPDFTGIPYQPFVEAIFAGIRPQLDANYKRFLNGQNGGPPIGSRNNPNGRRGKGTNRELTGNLPNVNVNENLNENVNVKVVRKTRQSEQELTLPFQDPEFISTWKELVTQPKWRNKTQRALSMSLKQLSKYDVRFAVWLMQNAIAGNYQGVVFDDTPAKYSRWLQVTPMADPGEPSRGTVVGNVNDLYND